MERFNKIAAAVLAFVLERLTWLLLGLLAPFAVPIFVPEVRAILLGTLVWQPEESRYLLQELRWGIAAPAYIFFVAAVTAYGPVVWTRERVRGRGKLAEIKAVSQYRDGVVPRVMEREKKADATSGCRHGGS